MSKTRAERETTPLLMAAVASVCHCRNAWWYWPAGDARFVGSGRGLSNRTRRRLWSWSPGAVEQRKGRLTSGRQAHRSLVFQLHVEGDEFVFGKGGVQAHFRSRTVAASARASFRFRSSPPACGIESLKSPRTRSRSSTRDRGASNVLNRCSNDRFAITPSGAGDESSSLLHAAVRSRMVVLAAGGREVCGEVDGNEIRADLSSLLRGRRRG